MLFDAFSGMNYRGWMIAKAHGLRLQHVTYPPHDDPRILMHPDLNHDESGQVIMHDLDE